MVFIRQAFTECSRIHSLDSNGRIKTNDYSCGSQKPWGAVCYAESPCGMFFLLFCLVSEIFGIPDHFAQPARQSSVRLHSI